MSRTVRVSVTSSIQNVEQLESVSLAKWGSAGFFVNSRDTIINNQV
jgi:hypothetical protein